MQESILATTRDALYGWTAERLVRKQTAIGQPAFLYFFDHGYPAADDAGICTPSMRSELPFVFGTPDRTPPLWPKIPATQAEANLSDAMIGLLDQLCAHRPAAGRNAAGLAALRTTAAYMAFSGCAACRRIICCRECTR